MVLKKLINESKKVMKLQHKINEVFNEIKHLQKIDEEKGYEQLQEIENKWSYKYASAYKIRESH